MQFTPIPVTYRELYQNLYDAHAIAPFHLKPLQPPYPKWYDANARCEYHAGISGHSIENCTGFKKAVERLIKNGVLKFESTQNTENHLPNHDNQGVNVIGEAVEKKEKENVDEIRMPMRVIWEEMMKRGMLTSKNTKERTWDYGKLHEDCEEFKTLVQGFIDNKELQVYEDSSSKKQVCVLENEQQRTSRPMIIISLPGNNEMGTPAAPKVIIHTPTPFPYKDSKKVPWSYGCSVTVLGEGSIASESKDGDVRVEPTKPKNVEIEKKSEVSVNEPVREEEAKEFLKFLKHSEYSMVEQLRKQPARISLLALLLSSEVHRETLLKVLNETYVTQDISVKKLDQLPIDSSHMKTCHNVVRASDGTERKVMGQIDIPLEIGPNTYEVDFLLVTDGRLITINAEEDIIAAVTSKPPYVETNEETIECSFRSLEIVNATFILKGSEVSVPRMSKATRMALQIMVRKGVLPGKGLGKQLQGGIQVPKFAEKKDHFGLGFKPDHKQKRQEMEKRQARRKARLNGGEVEWELMTFPPISKNFKSGGLLVEESHQINVVHNEWFGQENLEDEVKKQFDTGFLQEVKYSE
ncbi:uncharacterized protein LOC128282136 [Gossypium arboreum]|uniref:uncharacterized protein LOC128282136 n=1 Tax=Gossypium arboreum TaxID=29729 RepID=UPI0022F1A53F|nr:uncharacterized protein LOC128282136 [Gossypium arboreum]